jgi:hypothetical protein
MDTCGACGTEMPVVTWGTVKGNHRCPGCRRDFYQSFLKCEMCLMIDGHSPDCPIITGADTEECPDCGAMTYDTDAEWCDCGFTGPVAQ